MATTIKLKNSVTTTAAPSSLVQGEVAANITDKKLWVGDASSTPVQILGAGAPVSGTTATFTGNQIISVTDNTNAALRITQLGTGNALLVEDSANPDSTPVVIDNGGFTIVGYTAPIPTVSFTGGAITPLLQVQGSGLSSSSASVSNWSGTASSSSSFVFSKSNSGTVGTRGAVASGTILGNINFAGDDGTSFIAAASITSTVDGTPGTNDMPGRLVFSTTADGASTPTERMRINSAGIVTIGGTSAAYQQLALNGTYPTSSATTEVFSARGTIPSGSTTAATVFLSRPATEAATFTIANLRHFHVNPGTFGASSTVTSQYGFIVDSTLTGATSNYGFYGNIASGTGRWNFYAGGTADNYFAGNVLINGTSSVGGEKLQTFNSSNGIYTYLASTGAYVTNYYKSRSGTVGTNTIVNNGDSIGGFIANGADGTNYIESAKILAQVDGTPGTNDMPGRLVFYTTADGASSATERMRIDSSGNVGIGTSAPDVPLSVVGRIKSSIAFLSSDGSVSEPGYRFTSDADTGIYMPSVGNIGFATAGTERMRIDSSGNLLVGKTSATANGGDLQVSSGITFPATQVAKTDANTLDDYEEGTFTPVVIGTSVAGTGTYTTQVGSYTKIGNTVTVSVAIVYTGHTGTGNIRISGLPFTSLTATSREWVSLPEFTNMTMPASTIPFAYVSSNASFVALASMAVGSGTTTALAIDAAAGIFLSLTYQTA